MLVVAACASWLAVPESASAAKLQFSYKWSDGPAVAVKTLSEANYRCANPPQLIVDLPPSTSGTRVVVSEYKSGSDWVIEDQQSTVKTQVKGTEVERATLTVPLCTQNGAFVKGTYDYRIRVIPSPGKPNFTNERTKVKYVPKSSSGSSGSSGSSSSSGSSGSSGSRRSSSSFVGWNLEDVQDYLGYDPRTVDCSGSRRSVWWSSNWWVIQQISGVLVVSKARGYCS